MNLQKGKRANFPLVLSITSEDVSVMFTAMLRFPQTRVGVSESPGERSQSTQIPWTALRERGRPQQGDRMLQGEKDKFRETQLSS